MDSIPPPRIKTPVEKKQRLDNTDKLRTRLIKTKKQNKSNSLESTIQGSLAKCKLKLSLHHYETQEELRKVECKMHECSTARMPIWRLEMPDARMRWNTRYGDSKKSVHAMNVPMNATVESPHLGEGGREKKLKHVKPCNECPLEPKWFHIHIMKFQPYKQN